MTKRTFLDGLVELDGREWHVGERPIETADLAKPSAQTAEQAFADFALSPTGQLLQSLIDETTKNINDRIMKTILTASPMTASGIELDRMYGVPIDLPKS